MAVGCGSETPPHSLGGNSALRSIETDRRIDSEIVVASARAGRSDEGGAASLS